VANSTSEILGVGPLVLRHRDDLDAKDKFFLGDIMPTKEQFDRVERLLIGLYVFIPLAFILGEIL